MSTATTLTDLARARTEMRELDTLFIRLSVTHISIQQTIADACELTPAMIQRHDEVNRRRAELATFLAEQLADRDGAPATRDRADLVAGYTAVLDRRVTAARGPYNSLIDRLKKLLELLVGQAAGDVKQLSASLSDWANSHPGEYPPGKKTLPCTYATFSYRDCPARLELANQRECDWVQVLERIAAAELDERIADLSTQLMGWLVERGVSAPQAAKVASLAGELVPLIENTRNIYSEMLSRSVDLDRRAIVKLANGNPPRLASEKLRQLNLKIVQDTSGSWKATDISVLEPSLAVADAAA